MEDRITRARQLRRALEMFVASIGDESAMLEVSGVYPKWKAGVGYKIGDVVRCGLDANGETMLWRVLQAHTSQADWLPGEAASLYGRVGVTADGIDVWTQPLGASDAYQQGDRVSHRGAVWVSACDGNVWEPGVYGWTETEES